MTTTVLTVLLALWHNAVVHAGLLGLVGAAGVDIHAFRSSPTWRVDGFNWGLATKRWFIGFTTAALTAAGYGGLVGLAG